MSRSSKNFQQDWQQATALTVYAIYVHLGSNGTARHEVPSLQSFVAPKNARRINALWFTSLTLSLAVSLLAILAKQWLNEYKSRMRSPSSSPKMWAMRHSAYKGGLERWGMDAFISMLPLVLHVALFLFLIGLCFFLIPLDGHIMSVVTGITVLLATFYIMTGLAPIFQGNFPSATPMLRYLYSFGSIIGTSVRSVVGLPIDYAATLYLWLLLFAAVLLFSPFLGVTAVADCCFGYDIVPRFQHLSSFNDNVDDAIRSGGFRRVWLFIHPANYGATVFFLKHVITPSFDIARDFNRTIVHYVMHQSPIHAVFRYRPKATLVPAFDQARILANGEPLREASVLTWMIRSLPTEEDIQAAICAVGWLSASRHLEYFQTQKRDNPLLHKDLRRATIEALDNIAMRVDIVPEATIAGILRACLFMAEGPIALVKLTEQFLASCTENVSHDLHSLSLSIIHTSNAAPTSVSVQPVDPRIQSAELIALSGTRSRPCPRGITWAALNADKTPYSASFVSTTESLMLGDDNCRNTGWTPRINESLSMRLIAAVDIGLRYSDIFKMYDWERRTISVLYGAVAQSLAPDSTVYLPLDLQSRLHWTTTEQFRDYEFSVADLNAIATLLLRVIPAGRSCILPATLFNLLHHFERPAPRWNDDTVSWVKESFQPPADCTRLVAGLGRHRSAKHALLKTHLSLLRPISLSDEPGRSPWGQMLIRARMSHSGKELAKIATPYTVLLLVLHRRGHRNEAQALLRELLPCESAIHMICQGTEWRRELALHAKVISRGWWSEMRQRLTQAEHARAWVSCADFTNATEFVTALSVQEDCPGCAHDEIRIRWGTAPALPDANAPESELTVHDPAVWEPPELEASGRWYTGFAQLRRGARGAAGSTDNGGDVEMGPVPAGVDEAVPVVIE